MKNIIKIFLMVSISTACASKQPGAFGSDQRCRERIKDFLPICMSQLPVSNGRPSGKVAAQAFCHLVLHAKFMSCMQQNNNSVVTK